MKTLNTFFNKNTAKAGIENFSNFSLNSNEMNSVLGGVGPINDPIMYYWIDDEEKK